MAPSAYAPLPESRRHRAQGVLADRGHHRQDHEAHHDARAGDVEYPRLREYFPEYRGYEEQREVAVHDRRDSRQHLKYRFEYAAEPGRGVFAEEDCRQDPDRQRHDHRDERDRYRAVYQRQHSEVLGGEQRGPARAGEEVDYGNLAEKLDGLAKQRGHDSKRREYRNRRARKQNGLNCALEDRPALTGRASRNQIAKGLYPTAPGALRSFHSCC